MTPRMQSITHAIPFTKHTDPNNFPKGEKKPYPYMMRQANGKPFMIGRSPAIVQDEDEEAAFRAANPTAMDRAPTGASMMDENAKLKQRIAELEGQQGGMKTVAIDTEKPPAESVSGLVRPAAPVPDAPPPSAPPQAAKPLPRPGKKLD